MAILLLATLDTKGTEAAFLREKLTSAGVEVITMDVGVLGPVPFAPQIRREEVFQAAGVSWEAIRDEQDRGRAVTYAAEGARVLAVDLWKKGRLDGILAIGGSAGTTIATAAMRALPFGVPKLMVSTLASGQVRPFVGPRDIMMFHSVTDISGINRISRSILVRAAGAMVGMLRASESANDQATDKPILTATMFGVTTPCVEACRAQAEGLGYEVLVFHAVGTGGEAMESLIADGLVAGVLDMTTTELADECVGGVLSAGPDRLTAAARAGIPQVVSLGALDMVNFGPKETVPERFAHRTFYIHNANVTLMRTTPEENAELGRSIAQKLLASTAPYRVLIPRGGISAIDRPGQPFWDPNADEALFSSLRSHLPASCLIERDEHINDPALARCAVDTLISLIQEAKKA